MKNILKKILASITILTFCGCSGASTDATANTTSLEGKDVSTYLLGAYVDVSSAQAKLKDAGFEIVATYSPVSDGTTIVFTNSALKAEGAKPKRSHVSVLRLFIDEQDKKISFTNPVYFGKAFMQDEYNHTVFNAQLEKINKAFPNLKDSEDKMKFDNLAGYHFMIGMPYYSDVDKLGDGTTEELLAKAKEYKKGKSLIFELKLSDNSYLVGYDLGKRTKKFVEKIGRANAAILPYAISIENGIASSMEAKYYIALSYPLLTMTEFTTIASIPGAIAKDLEKPFK
ncbi:hypothetical protein KKG72_11255 [bacterium]|nr:hypothetical protein [bacterium]MBU1993718.1 hypothetical protein [bacterium]